MKVYFYFIIMKKQYILIIFFILFNLNAYDEENNSVLSFKKLCFNKYIGFYAEEEEDAFAKHLKKAREKMKKEENNK
jgi:hypothetical protein